MSRLRPSFPFFFLAPGASTGIGAIGSATDNAIVRWDGAGGATLQNSVVVIDDTGGITGVLSLSASGAGNKLSLTNTTDANSVQVAILQGDRATMADQDEAYVSLQLSDDGGTQTEVARITWAAPDVNVATSVDGRLDFSVMLAGTLAKELQLSGADLAPSTADGLSLGTLSLPFSDLFLASGSIINFNNDVTIEHAANVLIFDGATSGYKFNNVVVPYSDDGAALGTTSLKWSDLFLSSGGVINWDAGTMTLTETGGTLVFAGGVVALGTAPTMTSPAITTSLTTPSTTFGLLAATATTINFATATTTLNIGGTGVTTILNFGGGATASELRFLEPSGSGTNYTAFKTVAQAANITYSLPPTVGGANTFLTDVAGNGVLTWATVSAGGDLVTYTAAPGAFPVSASLVDNTDDSVVMRHADGASQKSYWSCKVPTGATSISAITFAHYINATGDVVATVSVKRRNTDTSDSTNSQDSDATRVYTAVGGTASRTGLLSVNSAAWNGITGIDADDIIEVVFLRVGADASDTYADNFDVIGMEVTFA